MNSAIRGFFPLMLIAAVAAILASCKQEELPATPSSPFLFNGIRIQKDLVPVAETVLHPGQQAKVHYSVAYTLDPSQAAMRNNLRLFVTLYGIKATDSLLGIGTFPNATHPLPQDGGVITDSITLTVPTNAARVNIEAFLDTLPTAGYVIEIHELGWPVR